MSLFFAGLVVFLWNVDLTIFKVVLSWISVCTALYGCITLIPIFRHNSPYYSPLTRLVQPVVVVILFVFTVLYVCLYGLVVCCSSFWKHCRGLVRIISHPYSWFIRVLNLASLTPEEAILKSSSEIDTRAFTWTFESLDEDHELDRFFSGLPGFHNSRILKGPLYGVDDQQKLRLLEAAIRLLDRTLSSNVLPDQVKRQRVDICTNAIDLVVTPDAFIAIILGFATEDRYGPAQSTEIVEFVRRWNNREDQNTTLVQAIFSIVVARVQRHDDSWFNLASNELGIPETVLREYATHGVSLSLAILIYVTRQQFTHIRNPSWPSKAISDVLRAASKNFNLQDTSPELQHEFCVLWNEIVREANKGTSEIPEYILGPIRNLYLALHRGTNSAPTRFSSTTDDDDVNLWVSDTYPQCNISGHIHDDSASRTCLRDVPHDDAALSPASPVSPVAPPSPSPVPLPVDNSLTTAPLPGNLLSIHQTTESFPVSVTSPDQAATSAMRDTVTLGIATPLPTPEISTSTPPLSPTSLSDSVSLRHSTNALTPPCPPNFPSSVSSNPALDNMLDTGPSLFSHLPITHLITRNSYRYSQRFSRADLYDTTGRYSRE